MKPSRFLAFLLPRRLAAKLVLAVLAAGLLPAGVVGAWAWGEAKVRMTEAVVESWLVRVARETAAQIDRELELLRDTAVAWAEEEQTILDARAVGEPGLAGSFAAQRLGLALSRRAERFGDVPFVGVLGENGRLLATGGSDRSSAASALAGRSLADVVDDPSGRAWIERALTLSPGSPPSARDWHRSPIVDAFASVVDGATRRREIGFSVPIRPLYDDAASKPFAALVVLFRFDAFQHVLDQVQRRFAERDVDSAAARRPRYPSGYPFLFAADADTVIGHRDRAVVGTSLVQTHGQTAFQNAMLARDYGFHHYDYPPGTGKITGFSHCEPVDRGGFGWIVGVGVNRSDVFADVERLRDVVVAAGLFVAGLVAVIAALFAARLAEPLRRLAIQTERLARGDYDARVEVRTRDEVALLSEGFNRLAAKLQESGRRLVEAEKNAAWKEMARQVAHEIKNPLTPIMLAAQQIERAHGDKHPQLDEIVAESTRSIVEQCASLKKIAQNFASYAAFPQSRKERRPLAALVADAVRLYAPNRDDGPKVVLRIEAPEDAYVMADEDELRRVFLNLFNNAFEAMGPDGVLTVTADVVGRDDARRARIRISDTGRGIDEDDRSRLFEPNFSTRSGGTGLGLAICRKILQEHRGDISVESVVGVGTTFTITLPAAPSGEGSPPVDPFGETRTVFRS